MHMPNVSGAQRQRHDFFKQHISRTGPISRAGSMYRSLLVDSDAAATRRIQRSQSYAYLLTQLEAADLIDGEIPEDPTVLVAWMQKKVTAVGEQYQSYIAARKLGEPRRFFVNKSHALNFLRAVAPTKLVDGAWLYGLLQQWRSPHVAALIDIYLDEIGHGMAVKNHVLLHKKLLADEGIDTNAELSEGHYVQGAIQLALAHHGDSFFAEILGFNLGYEQLPPYFFDIH
jgi:hypothetical protein